MSDVDSKALMCARVNPFLAVPPARGQDSAPSVLLTLLAACFLKPTHTTAAFHPPGHSRWIVTMSPIFLHSDAELGELLKTLGLHKMERVSAKDLLFWDVVSIW